MRHIAMENHRILNLERWFGYLLMGGWAIWYLSHRHQPANRITDCFAILGGLGAVALLHVFFKSLNS
jgi:hypothetical protein